MTPPSPPWAARPTSSAEAWWAEATTKSVFVAGTPARNADVTGALVATVDAHGHVDLPPELARIAA